MLKAGCLRVAFDRAMERFWDGAKSSSVSSMTVPAIKPIELDTNHDPFYVLLREELVARLRPNERVKRLSIAR